jgi:membrane protease YdiL (CAAX protease family)
MSKRTKQRIGLFLLLTLIFSTVFHVFLARQGTLRSDGRLYAVGLMWSPGIAALLTQLLLQGSIRGLGWRWGKTRYQLLSILLPILLISVTYGVVWLTGLGGFPNEDFVVNNIESQLDFDATRTQAILIYVAVSGLFGLITTSFTALGEEIGWRGLLVPALSKVTGFTGTALISGIIWALYHYPGILFTDYHSAAPMWYNLLCFTVMAVGFSIPMAWVRLKSGSVWTAMFLHASHNVFVQSIFTPLTFDTGPTEYVIDEFGVGLAVVYLIAGIVFWRMRDQLPKEHVLR